MAVRNSTTKCRSSTNETYDHPLPHQTPAATDLARRTSPLLGIAVTVTSYHQDHHGPVVVAKAERGASCRTRLLHCCRRRKQRLLQLRDRRCCHLAKMPPSRCNGGGCSVNDEDCCAVGRKKVGDMAPLPIVRRGDGGSSLQRRCFTSLGLPPTAAVV
nr:hypothetical protein Iba_chr02eCG5550 [Ipomoea batatas]